MKGGLFAFCWAAFLDQKVEPILLNMGLSKSSRDFEHGSFQITWISKAAPLPGAMQAFLCPGQSRVWCAASPAHSGWALTPCTVTERWCKVGSGVEMWVSTDRVFTLRLAGRAKASQIVLICHPWKNNFLLCVAFLLFTAIKGWPF